MGDKRLGSRPTEKSSVSMDIERMGRCDHEMNILACNEISQSGKHDKKKTTQDLLVQSLEVN